MTLGLVMVFIFSDICGKIIHKGSEVSEKQRIKDVLNRFIFILNGLHL